MKRTPLNRKTPLTRKTRLKPVSKKRQKAMKDTNPTRAEYREHSACGMCLLNGGLLTQAKDVHEIIGGPVRPRTMKLPQFWVPLCRAHHDEVQSDPKVRAKVFAAKVVAELLRVNEMLAELGREPIDLNDVAKELG